jgi:hypothetical protein
VFGVKDSLICEFTRQTDPETAAELGLASRFWSVQHEFKLVRG